MSDALFGVDGTELPQLWSDSSERDGSRSAPELPPFRLPAIPGLGATREEVAAAPSAPRPDAPPAHALSAHVRAANALAANAVSAHVPSANVTASLLVHAAPQLGGPSAAVAPDHSRSRVPAPVPPGKLAPPTRRRSFLRSPLAAGSRTPALLSDLRRRVGRQGAGVPLRLGSSGGAGAFFFIAVIIFLILAYGIIAGIVESIIRLFQ